MSHTRIKFCGLTRAEDVRLAVELGVDYLGLVFAAGSPRQLSLSQACELRALVPEEIAVVALVMDDAAASIRSIIEQVRPDLLQFHGHEQDTDCAGFGVPFFKVIAMGGDRQEHGLTAAAYPSAYGLLLDGHAQGEQGGSGQRFDWTRVPAGLGKPFLLAGGLCPDNVAAAIHTARPWGVDVSSGIESSPGVKDADRMRHFVEETRRADSRRNRGQD